MLIQNMTVITRNIQIKSKSENDIIDITDQVSKIVKESKIENGAVIVFVIGSTAAITTMEYEPGLQQDFPKMLWRLVPKEIEYAHDNTLHDGNGHSHVRASLIGPSLSHSVYSRSSNTWHLATNSIIRDGYRIKRTQNHIATNK